jgi:hypothetical protein
MMDKAQNSSNPEFDILFINTDGLVIWKAMSLLCMKSRNFIRPCKEIGFDINREKN